MAQSNALCPVSFYEKTVDRRVELAKIVRPRGSLKRSQDIHVKFRS